MILLTFGLVALLSGVACYYFSLFRPRRPAVTALVLLTAFIFWQDLRGACLATLSKVGDFVYWDQHTGYLKELSSSEASDYTYGGSGNHAIIAGKYGIRSPAYNHIEVFSSAGEAPVFGDEVDYSEVDLVGHRLQKVFDYAYDLSASARGGLRLSCGSMGPRRSVVSWSRCPTSVCSCWTW